MAESTAIKGVNNHGFPMHTKGIDLPRNHPLPMWCECGAAMPWHDLGVLQYQYPFVKQHVFICSACGKYSVHFRVRRGE